MSWSIIFTSEAGACGASAFCSYRTVPVSASMSSADVQESGGISTGSRQHRTTTGVLSSVLSTP
jgi:hypothetical protein